MSEAERKALLELWAMVPGTKPDSISPITDGYSVEVAHDKDEVAVDRFAIGHPIIIGAARDAIVEWLYEEGITDYAWELGTPTCDDDWSLTISMRSFSAPTRLLALISAAKAVHEGSK